MSTDKAVKRHMDDEEEAFDDEEDGMKFEFESGSESGEEFSGREDEDENEEEEEEDEEGDEDIGESSRSPATNTEIPSENRLSSIKNKLKRRQLFEKLEAEKRKEKMKRKKRGQGEDENKKATRTIDNSCGFPETFFTTDKESDPFDCYFDKEKEPKLIMTTVEHPRSKTIRFCKEFAQTIPNTEFKFRRNCSIKGTMKAAYERGFTHLIVVNQDERKPNGVLVIHLPDGPTANFKLSSVKYHRDLRRRGQHSHHRPEIIVNNFHTRLGQTIGRMFASLCHFDPQFKGRRVVTFHNQRDYIFFRHHRYEFKNNKRVALQEIGPRFTLRLRWFQKGPFDTKSGNFDWVSKRDQKDKDGKRIFFL